MSIFEDVMTVAAEVGDMPAEVIATDAPGDAAGSGFVTVTPNTAPNVFAGGFTVGDHLGHQGHVMPNHAPNAYQGGATVDDGQGHAEVWMPLPSGGLWHP